MKPRTAFAATLAIAGWALLGCRPLAAEEPTPRTTLYGHTSPVGAGFFSPDGKMLVTRAEKTLLWDLAAEKSKQIGDGLNPTPLFFSPDGKLLMLSRDTQKEIQIYDIAGDKNSVLSILPKNVREQNPLMSPDGQSYVVWDAKHNLVLRQLPTPYDVTTGRNEVALEGVSLRWDPFHMQFSADGKTLVTKNQDGAMMLWDVGSGKSITSPEARGNDLALSPDSKTMVVDYSAARGDTRVFDLATGKSIATLQKVTLKGDRAPGTHPNLRVYSPDSKTIAEPSVTAVLVWDATTGKNIAVLKKPKGPTNDVRLLCFSPDGKTLAVATGEACEIWDIANGQILASLPNEGVSYFMAVSPDGATWATTGRDGRIRLWDAPAPSRRTKNESPTLHVPTPRRHDEPEPHVRPHSNPAGRRPSPRVGPGPARTGAEAASHPEARAGRRVQLSAVQPGRRQSGVARRCPQRKTQGLGCRRPKMHRRAHGFLWRHRLESGRKDARQGGP